MTERMKIFQRSHSFEYRNSLLYFSRLVLDKFAAVTVGIENYNRRKVLAGIVMIENCDINTAKVISVSTGTKCVNGEHLSCYGAVLNDSHAEIVSRRCLMDYFYAQLDLHANTGELNKMIRNIRLAAADLAEFVVVKTKQFFFSVSISQLPPTNPFSRNPDRMTNCTS